MKGVKTCYHCIHGEFHRGSMGTYYEPPEPDYTECLNENVSEEIQEQVEYDEEKLPLICGHYEPKMVKKCAECNNEMNIPEHDVEYYTEYENPVCGKACYDKWYKEFEKQFDESFREED